MYNVVFSAYHLYLFPFLFLTLDIYPTLYTFFILAFLDLYVIYSFYFQMNNLFSFYNMYFKFFGCQDLT